MKICGARRHKGAGICRKPGTGRGGRCRLHGGAWNSGRNHNPPGFSKEARAAWRAKQDWRRANGIKAPWGQPPKAGRVKKMADDTAREIETVLTGLPAAVDKPPDQMTLPELLQETSRHGLMACLDICRRYEPEMDLKERRLVVDVTGQALRTMIRVMEEGFKARRDDKIDKLLAELEGTR